MELFSTLFLLGTFNGIILGVILLVNSYKNPNRNIFLALLLLIISGFLLKQYLLNEYSINEFPHLIASFIPLLFLIGPLFYFFIKYGFHKEVHWNRSIYMHFLPAAACLISIIPFYLKSGNEKYLLYISGHHYFPYKGLYYWCFGALLIVYSIKTINISRNQTKDLDRRTRRFSDHHNLSKYFTWLFSAISLCYIIALSLLSFSSFHHYEVFLSIILAFSFLIHFVGFWSIKESKITRPKPSHTNRISLNKNQIEIIKKNILFQLEDKKVFKKNDLSSKFFCNELSINSQYLSHVINSEFNCNLTFLINSYRINEAKNMIKSEDYSHLNFLGIAMEAGFNTKNTFTRSFKRHTGMTPTEYKSNILVST